MAAGEFEFDIDAPDLRVLLDHLKAVEPKLATALRRELRASGDSIIAEQRAILNGAKPGSVRVARSELRLIVPKNGRKPYFAKRNVFDVGADKTGGVSDLRDKIAAGLKTRVVAGASRQSVSIKTTGPRNGSYNMALVWSRSMFRHPVFGDTSKWVYQKGQPYFWSPAKKGIVQVRERIAAVVDEALARLSQN